LRIKTLVSLILAFLLVASSFTVASVIVAVTPVLMGVKVNVFFPVSSSVRYVSSSDYFYVSHGLTAADWNSLTAEVQSAFLDPQQCNFTLQTSAPNFENPTLTQYTEYYEEFPYTVPPTADVMVSGFFFQFRPGDLAPGTYSFTGTLSAVALANPPSYEALYYQNTITLVVLPSSSTLVSCSPNPVSIGWPVTCTATVSGSNPTGTVNWTTSSIAGSFSQSVCTLSNGSCSTFYTENSTGSVTITASYSGDSHNGASSASFTLTVFINITVGVNVTVHPTSDLELTFSNVTAAGYATTNKTSTVEAPPLANLVGQYYDIRVTASYSGSVTVSLAYDDTNMTPDRESTLQMMQYAPIPGDVVNYGEVNILDIVFLAQRFGTTPESPNWNAAADVTGSQYLVPDGKIDIRDIYVCAVNFAKTSEWTSITTHVDLENNLVHAETTHFSIIGIH